MLDDRLQDAINEACEPYTEYYQTWDEIREYYRDQHSEHTWIGALAMDLTGSANRRGKAYSAARRNIERWTAGVSKPGKKSRSALAALGKTLPPKRRGVPPGGIDVTIQGTIKISKDRRWRDIQVHMDELEAFELANDPSYEAVFEAYGVDGDMFAGGMESDCTVTIS